MFRRALTSARGLSGQSTSAPQAPNPTADDLCSKRSISNPPGRVCAPQARPPARRRRKFWGIKGPGRVLGRKPSREGFGAETLPGGFVWYLMAQTVNPPGRACVSAGYHPTIYLSANPPDRVFGANRKTGGFLCVRRLSPNHRLKRKPCRQGFWRKL